MSVDVNVKVNHGSIPSVIADLEAAESTSAYNVAQFVQKRVREFAPIRTGYLKKSVSIEKITGRTWRVSVGASYGGFVEFGTRHMAAQPFFIPAVEEARAYFLKDMTDRVKEACGAR
jgi:HK97 gp10 family phage protein